MTNVTFEKYLQLIKFAINKTDSTLYRSLKGQSHEIFDPRFFFINQSHFGHWLTG
jgi:hypothetical protein